MITSLRIHNLRSLKDTGFVDLKKITILLGTNSSGKSTFLRSFPLLTQSIKKDLRNAISWFDDASVDFGDYKSSKCNKAFESEQIGFEFRVAQPWVSYRLLFFSRFRKSSNLTPESDIVVGVNYAEDAFGTYVKSVKLQTAGIDFLVHVDCRNAILSFCVNGLPVMEGVPEFRFNESSQRCIIPEVVLNDQNETNHPSEREEISEVYASRILQSLVQFCSRKLRRTNRLREVLDNWSYEKEDFLFYIQNNITISSFKRKAANWTINTPSFVALYNQVAIVEFLRLIPIVNEELTFYYNSCSYVAPIRAEANRYYRNQGLQIEDIDAYGRNLQEFISSLNADQVESYNRFCQKVLGVSISVDPSRGLNSIMVFNESGKFNISDVGFGYSQILPIITKLWYSQFSLESVRRSRYDPTYRTFLMEQPELHLHPAMQARVADAFIECTRDLEPDAIDRQYGIHRGLKLIIETHSPTIINRLGRRIREKKLSPADINVVIFEKKDGVTNTRQISFDDNGRLNDWPYGFFDPED